MLMTPGCDLHLLRTGPPQLVRILAESANPPPEIQADPNIRYAVRDPAIVAVVNGVFTPVGLGETVVRVALTDGAGHELETGFVRVNVRTAITTLRIANRVITLRAGSADYVPSVYAAFDSGPLVDVTGHAYVTISAAPNAPFTVTPGDPLGRLHAAANATGIGTVVATANGLNVFTSVMIAPALATERRIVERVRYQGPHDKHRNILFLAEGYPSRAVFDRHVSEITDRFFTSPMYSPFPQLAHRFNVWSAYELWSVDVGITLATPVTSDGYAYPVTTQSDLQHYAPNELTLIVGLPGASPPTTVADAQAAWAAIPGFDPAMLDQMALDGWRKHATLEPSAPKDSLFGTCFGQRTGGPAASPERPAFPPVPGTAHWELLPALDSRTMTFDVRRLPEHAAFPGHYNPDHAGPVNDFFQQYLESLKHGSDPNHPDFHVGRVWTTAGADEGLIVLLVYDELNGGTAIGFRDAGGQRHRVAIIFAIGDRKNVSLTSGSSPREHVPRVDSINKDRVATKVLHEIAHAFGLLDEYENTDGTGAIDGSNEPVADIEMGTNTMHVVNVVDPATNFVLANNTKWNWDRILMASEVADVSPPPPGAPHETPVTLVPGQAAKWRAKTQNTDVYLRVRDINVLPAALASVGPFRIESITGDVLTLTGPLASILTFQKGCVLYEPAMDGANRRTVMHRAVHDFLLAHPPFGINAIPAAPTEGSESPPGIPNLKKPKHRPSVIGVYDGAATFNINAYRPAGSCRMRNVDYWTITQFRRVLIFPWFKTVPRVTQFCFVCKYALVNQLGPEAFDTLDREYPEDC